MERAWIACWFGCMVALVVLLGFPLVSHSEPDDSYSAAGSSEAIPYESSPYTYSYDEAYADRTPGLSVPTQYPTGENAAVYDDVAHQFEEYSQSAPAENYDGD